MKKIFALLFLVVSLSAQAQDFGVRAEVEVEKKISDAFAAHLSVQGRYSSTSGNMMSYIGEAGLEYFIIKKLSVSGFYRYIGTNYIDADTPDVYHSFHRFAGNLTYKDQFNSWLKFENRLRYQNQFKDENYGLITDGRYFRNKVTLGYKTGKLVDPYIAGDVFYETRSGFDEIRCQVGVAFNFKNKNGLDISIMQDRAFKTGKVEPLVFAFVYKFKL
jgi:hypothetical protein